MERRGFIKGLASGIVSFFAGKTYGKIVDDPNPIEFEEEVFYEEIEPEQAYGIDPRVTKDHDIETARQIVEDSITYIREGSDSIEFNGQMHSMSMRVFKQAFDLKNGLYSGQIEWSVMFLETDAEDRAGSHFDMEYFVMATRLGKGYKG